MPNQPGSGSDEQSSESLAMVGGPEAVAVDEGNVFDWPIVTEEDEEAALAVLREGSMSDTDVTKKFESEFADWQGAEYALGSSSGTESIQGAMHAVGVGAGDEVIGPSVAYWAAVLPCMGLGATPVFADIERDTLCIDAESFEARISDHTEAVVVVHNYGHPADMDSIAEIAAEHDIAIIEDVSHAQGGEYKGRTLGTIGDVGVMSLMSRKSLAIGEAGMMVTDDREIYERAVSFGHYARHDDELTIPELEAYAGLPQGGCKHRMHQISAAVGRVQLKHYDERVAEIQEAMNYFWELLSDVRGIRAHRPDHEESTMGGWYSPKALYDPDRFDGLPAGRFAEAVRAEGGSCSAGCNAPLHEHPLLHDADVYGLGKPTRLANADRDVREAEGSLPVSESIQENCLRIPWFKQYRPDVIEQHAAAYRKVANGYRELLEAS